MSIATYILIYLAVGYLVMLVAAGLNPATKTTPGVVFVAVLGWGLIAVLLLWRAVCLPIVIAGQLRKKADGGAVNENDA